MSCYQNMYSRDSNTTFLGQLRDSSDVTTMIKQQSIRNNYQILHAKSASPVGGIPSADLYDMAHTTAAYAPMQSLLSGVSMQPCVACVGQLPFNMQKVSLSLIRY
jgi:hypothetical protein